MSTENNNENMNAHNATFKFMGGFFSDLGDLVSDIAGATVDLGCELGEIASDGAKEFADNPVKYTAESVVDIAEVAVPIAVGGLVGGVTGSAVAKAVGSKVAGAVVGTVSGVAAAEATGRALAGNYSGPVFPEIGSVVYCSLAGVIEHSGIYVGGSIIHLDGDGIVTEVSPEDFLGRLGGVNPAATIYVSSDDGESVGSSEAVHRAEKMVGESKDYSLALNNCHTFCSYCLTGDPENGCNTLSALKSAAKRELGATSWRKAIFVTV